VPDQRFDISYAAWVRPLLTVLGAGPAFSSVVVGEHEVRVRMGWAFRAEFPRTAISGGAADTRAVLGWGVHGWGGRWLVNGSASGVVAVRLDPAQPARVLGVVPVRLRELRVSLTDPDAFLRAIDQ